MLNFSHQTRVFLFLEPVDMRKSFRGLCQLAESVLLEDPASGHWFAFINRRRDRLKILRALFLLIADHRQMFL